MSSSILPGTENNLSFLHACIGELDKISVIPRYIHNHSENFVKPTMGLHTNNVENF